LTEGGVRVPSLCLRRHVVPPRRGFLGGVSVFKSEKRAMSLYRHIVENEDDDSDFVPRLNYQPFANRSWR
jgi:hypothetical protein